MKSTHSPKLRPALADALVVLLVLALAIGTAWWFYGGLRRSGPAEYIITHRGEEIARGPLSQPQEIAVDGEYHLQIVCDGLSIYVHHSDCPTQDCVHTGLISRGGQSIVCLPGRISVTLEGGGTAVDTVIG